MERKTLPSVSAMTSLFVCPSKVYYCLRYFLYFINPLPLPSSHPLPSGERCRVPDHVTSIVPSSPSAVAFLHPSPSYP